MKEMKYSSSYKEELLDNGEYKGFKYYIISLGWHPCAYVEIPIENEAYGCTYQCYPVNGIQCHGGIRYSKSMLSFPEVHGQGWFIGWDLHIMAISAVLYHLQKESSGRLRKLSRMFIVL